jgi:GTPase SAR1 family protein
MGQGGVGKTAMVTKFTTGDFDEKVWALVAFGVMSRVRGADSLFSYCSINQPLVTCTRRTSKSMVRRDTSR